MMFDEIEDLLDSGFRVGFEKPTDDPEYVGWILVSKVKPNERLLQVMSEEDSPELIREERRRQSEPYFLMKIELKRSVHEAGAYETESDYRQNEKYWFSDLKHVAEQLREWGYSLEEAKEARELDAP